MGVIPEEGAAKNCWEFSVCHHLLIANRNWGAEGAGWVSFAIIAFQSSLEYNESFSKKP